MHPERTTPYHPAVFLLIFLGLQCIWQPARAQTGTGGSPADFSSAQVIRLDDGNSQEDAAIELLVEEIEKRTAIRLPVRKDWTDAEGPVIVAGTKPAIDNSRLTLLSSALAGAQTGPEGFVVKQITETGRPPVILIAGSDRRGMLFGIGYFLRKVSMTPGKLLVPDDLDIETTPRVSLRGHQLGYRPKVNSYDGFTPEMWEQYIRDLIVFGTNAIELMPPNTDDEKDSPMFPLPQLEMMSRMSGLGEKYGLDTWIWYPMMHGDYTKPENIKRSLEENEEVFRKLPRIDAVFVPGGDPGRHLPEVLFAQLERMAAVLRKYHPDAEIWVSPQGFSSEWMEQFIGLLKKEPQWLTGVAHGPWISMDINRFRQVIPAKYPIRRYPDITHTLDAQYFMPDWDYAHAVTQHREPINPRPVDQAAVFRSADPGNYQGFITYSEGVNDDVNKIIWSGLGWDPGADITEILRDYGRFFIGPSYADGFAQGLLGLEKNWKGPLLTNRQVYTRLGIFQDMEKSAPPAVRLNWRFQQALYRSYYDAYTRRRLIYETSLEEEALDALRRAPATGSLAAMEKARGILSRAITDKVAADWRQRVFELAEALFQSIRMQTSVNKYFARDMVRGAHLDRIDHPLNDRLWLEERFRHIALLETEEERLRALGELAEWDNPGPGGYYDDLGDPGNQPHLVRQGTYEEDPNSYRSPFIGLAGAYTIESDRNRDWKVSWNTYMQTLYGHPLTMRYANLDPQAQYQVKVIYVEEEEIKLTADGNTPVHPYRKPPEVPVPLTFDIPPSATSDGELTLKWNVRPGGRGPGRGCSVAEVWLIRKP